MEEIKIIVGGKEYNVNKNIFTIKEEIPSLLPTLIRANKNQYIFKFPDQDPEIFEAVLRYYRTAGLFTIGTHLQEQPEFLQLELNFWGIAIKNETMIFKNEKMDLHAIEFVNNSIDFLQDLLNTYKSDNSNICPLFIKMQFAISYRKTINGSINPNILENMKIYQKEIFMKSNIYIDFSTNATDEYIYALWPANTIWEKFYANKLINVDLLIANNSKETFDEIHNRYIDLLAMEKKNKKISNYNCSII